MPKQNQIVAIEKGVKTQNYALKSQVYKAFQQAQLFNGLTRTYQKNDDDGEDFPPESKRVQRNAAADLNTLAESCKELFDITATKDWGNTQAKADVVVDEVVILSGVPATYLLFLEKQLNDMKDELNKLPTLDPSFDWYLDGDSGLYKSAPVQTTKTKKVPEVIVKYEATVEHPAQTELIPVDKVVGTWTSTALSGALPLTRKQSLQRRITKLIQAVKFARETANETPVLRIEAGAAVFDYLLAE